jgi:hypothetical protein
MGKRQVFKYPFNPYPLLANLELGLSRWLSSLFPVISAVWRGDGFRDRPSLRRQTPQMV